MIVLDAITPIIEIGVITIILNYLLSLFWNTRTQDLLVGLLAFLAIFTFSSVLQLPILYTIMSNLMNVAAVGLIMIFQPELRVALSRLGLKGKKFREVTEFDKFLDQIISSIYRLAEKRAGALIALERMDKLDEFAQKAVVLDAKFSSELLETIFTSTSPLHDGAIIIRGMTIVAAAVIFPLAEESVEIARAMGTRHRAALGISQVSDALVIAISEESGKVTIAREGVFSHRGVKPAQLKGVIHSIFSAPDSKPQRKKFLLREWIGG
jgi:diadenylate cyclase